MVTAPELPPPGIQSIDDRRQTARRLIIHAREELEKGNRLQAGEKAWGAVVHPLKGVAEQRGWKGDNYQVLREIGRQVAPELGDIKSSNALAVAIADAFSIGHLNFYENQHPEERLVRVIAQVEDALPDLEYLLDAPPRPASIDSETEAERLRLITRNPNLQVGDTSDVGFSLKHEPPDDHQMGTPSDGSGAA